ncbi:MAG: MoxR family ATPase [Desulforegulaceae bacterium]|nr:MoxR family ATPase [Desulforegulaceae bacterium]
MINTQVKEIISEVEKIILGKREKIILSLTCLLADGHLLIEDLPGIGKTSLANALSRVMGLKFKRIQCTSDMLPGDILGTSVFDQKNGNFTFHPGPVFTQVLLSDEINRTTPKTQSALLEAMEERQITIEGSTYQLKKPFFVIATQNPKEQAGTFPLPESQLDRFLFKINLGYPDRDSEKQILLQKNSISHKSNLINPVLDSKSVLEIQKKIKLIKTSDPVIEYLQDIIEFTRNCGYFKNGLSPRAGISILQSAKARAYIYKRDFLIPEDIKNVLPWASSHRLFFEKESRFIKNSEIQEILNEIKIS